LVTAFFSIAPKISGREKIMNVISK
jgi:hypothetical protein